MISDETRKSDGANAETPEAFGAVTTPFAASFEISRRAVAVDTSSRCTNICGEMRVLAWAIATAQVYAPR